MYRPRPTSRTWKPTWGKWSKRRRVSIRKTTVPKRAIPYPEKKWKDVSSAVAFDTTGTIALINGLDRGDDDGSRIGRKVTMKSLEIRGVAKPTVTTGLAQAIRVIVCYDTQTNAAAPGITDVLNTADAMSLRNMNGSNRFKILVDWYSQLGDATGDERIPALVHEFRSFTLPVQFNNGDAGTVADMVSGSVYLITLGELVAGVTAGAGTIRSRIRYIDN